MPIVMVNILMVQNAQGVNQKRIRRNSMAYVGITVGLLKESLENYADDTIIECKPLNAEGTDVESTYLIDAIFPQKGKAVTLYLEEK